MMRLLFALAASLAALLAVAAGSCGFLLVAAGDLLVSAIIGLVAVVMGWTAWTLMRARALWLPPLKEERQGRGSAASLFTRERS